MPVENERLKSWQGKRMRQGRAKQEDGSVRNTRKPRNNVKFVFINRTLSTTRSSALWKMLKTPYSFKNFSGKGI